MNTESQNKLIRKHLENGYSITQKVAFLTYGCFRLSARIYDLKRQGMPIITEMVYEGRKHYARYWLQFADTKF
jgi:hypothetical protein